MYARCFVLEPLEPRNLLSAAYNVEDIGLWTQALDVNNAGQVVGCSDDYDQPFVWSRTQGLEPLPIAAKEACAFRINSRGEIAGDSDNDSFLISGSNVQKLPSGIADLNDAGEALIQTDASKGWETLLFDGTRLSDVGTTGFDDVGLTNSGQLAHTWLGAIYDLKPEFQSRVYLLNPIEQLVRDSTGFPTMGMSKGGVSVVAGTLNGAIVFSIHSGESTRLFITPPVQADFFTITDVNNQGQFLAEFTVDHQYGGYFFDGVAFRALDSLIPDGSGWSDLSASALNDAGQIVGVGYRQAGDDVDDHGILMSPVAGANKLPLVPGDIAVVPIEAMQFSVYQQASSIAQHDAPSPDAADPLSDLREEPDVYA